MKVSEIKYVRYDVNKLINEYFLAAKKIEQANSVDAILEVRESLIEEITELDTAFNLAYVRWSLDTANDFYCKEKAYYEENIPLTAESKTKYVKSVLNCKFADELQRRLPSTLFSLYKCELEADNPVFCDELIKENALVAEYSDFMSALTVEFNGETIPFTVLKKYMLDKDGNVRKTAYDALGNALKANREFLDGNFNNLVDVRTKMAKKAGYEDFVSLGYSRMNRICYDYNDIAKFRNNVIKYVVPTVCDIKKKVGKNLGIEFLKLYDNDAVLTDGDVFPIKNGGKLFSQGKEIYSSMSKNTEEFFNMMLENEAFDCLSRKNKWGGGYETDLKKYNQPFILANFNGSSQDSDVLTHEAGHAYASFVMSKNNSDKEIGLPCMDIAETHSMSMEFFCWKYIDKLFGSNADKYKLKHFIDSFCFIPYGVMVDAFQEFSYKNYQATPSDRNKKWKELESVFRPYMNADGITYLEEGTRWQYQMHIYESPFYYIDYAIAQITALQFLFLSLENYDEAFKKYNEFISYGCDYNYLEILKKVGLKSPFDEDFIKEISSKCYNLFEKLFNDVNDL